MTIEELQEQLLQEKEEHEALKAQFNDLKVKNETLESDNKRLIDYNNKLFMRVTTEVKPEEKEPELSAEEKEQKQIEEIRKLMKERRI